MGVTNRNEIHYKKPDHASSTESLHIPQSPSLVSLTNASSSDEIHVPRFNTRQKRHNRLPIEGPVSSPRRNAGRRRLRRHTAVTDLAALIEEEDCELFEEGIPHYSPFTTILENPDLEKVWDNFLQGDECEQANIIDQNTAADKPKTVKPCYTNISFNVRMQFKMMRSFCELEKAEKEIIDFFTNFPANSFIRNDKSSYQRLLIHGVAQYYCLKSTSFDAEDGTRTIKVENPNNSEFCEKSLTSIIEDNRKIVYNNLHIVFKQQKY